MGALGDHRMVFLAYKSHPITHHRKERKNTGGLSDKSPLFTESFARLRADVRPSEKVDICKVSNVGELLPPVPWLVRLSIHHSS